MTVSTAPPTTRVGSFSALGQRFVVDVAGDAAMRGELRRLLADLADDTGAGGRTVRYDVQARGAGHDVLRDGEVRLEAVDRERVVSWVLWDLNRTAVEHASTTRPVLHAAGVRHGRDVVVLAGPSGSGKSTAAAALVRAGYGYLTDEALALDPVSAEVEPFPKPLVLKAGSPALSPLESAPTGARHLAARDLGGMAGPGGRVSLVLLLDAEPGAGAEPEPLTAGHLVLGLAACTFGFSSAGARNLSVLAALARTTPGYRFAAADLDAFVVTVDRLLEETA